MADLGPGGAGGFGTFRPNKSIAITLPPLPLWVPDAAKASLNAIISSTIRLAMAETAGQISDAADAAGAVDLGHLAQSFGHDPATGDGGMQLIGVDAHQGAGIHGRVFSSLPYAIVVEEGRRPGAPISREGIDALGRWAERHGMPNQAKWGIAHNIIAHGIEGRFIAQRGFDRARPRLEVMFAHLGDAIAKRLTQSTNTRNGG